MSPSMSFPSSGRPDRPIPDRTLRQPHRLTVASHDSSSGSNTDAACLRVSFARRAGHQRNAELWADRMMEETLDRATFKQATVHIHAQLLREVQHERHLNSLCSYPVCPNPPAEPFSASKRVVISTARRTISGKEGNEKDGFCSRRCEGRCRWVERQLGEEAAWLSGKREELELREEVEERRGLGTTEVGPTKTAKMSVLDVTPDPLQTPSKDSEVAPPAAPSLPSESATHDPLPLSDLLASLAIHEHPTPSSLPPAPSLDIPSILPQPVFRDKAFSQPSSQLAAKRAPSSLLAPPTRLTSTLLSASRQMGPMPSAADSDDQDGEPSEEEWEKAMGWGGEDEEARELFEEARKAREIMEAEEG